MSSGTPPKPQVSTSILSAVLVCLVLFPVAAGASQHFIDVNEVYTNADGSVQFVELRAYSGGQTFLASTRVEAYNADSTDINLLFDFTANFPALDNTETILLATAAFQDSAGFAPDFVMAPGVVAPSGRVVFDRDVGASIDAVAYGAYTGGNGAGAYGTPADSLPSDGFFSLTRIDPCQTNPVCVRNNSLDWDIVGNSPTRNDGTTTVLNDPTSIDVLPGLPHATLRLLQNQPNPARSETTIPFQLERDAHVTLRVYSVDGRLVRTLDAGRLGAGRQRIVWDGQNASNAPAAGGVYVYRLSADGASASRQMTLVR